METERLRRLCFDGLTFRALSGIPRNEERNWEQSVGVMIPVFEARIRIAERARLDGAAAVHMGIDSGKGGGGGARMVGVRVRVGPEESGESAWARSFGPGIS